MTLPPPVTRKPRSPNCILPPSAFAVPPSMPTSTEAYQREDKVMRLAGKVAIISGAASGMGAATAQLFAREGAKVVIADVLEHEGRQVTEAIGAAARLKNLDVKDEDNWAAVVAAAISAFGKLDVLVNNAGISGSAEQDFYSTD